MTGVKERPIRSRLRSLTVSVRGSDRWPVTSAFDNRTAATCHLSVHLVTLHPDTPPCYGYAPPTLSQSTFFLYRLLCRTTINARSCLNLHFIQLLFSLCYLIKSNDFCFSNYLKVHKEY